MKFTRTGGFADERIMCVSEMKRDGFLTDFVINVGDVEIKCHRMVLAAASPYFRAMFSHDLSESQAGTVELQDMNVDVVRDVVDYCYSGELDVPSENFKLYLQVAHFFRLKELLTRISTSVAQK